MIISYVFFMTLSKAGLFLIIPASEPIRAFGPIPASEEIPVGIPHHNKPSGIFSYAFQRGNSTVREQIFWIILNSLVPTLISLLISLIKYRYFQRKDVTKQELRMMLQTCESLMLELRGKAASMQKLVERRAQFQNEMVSQMTMMNVEDEPVQLLSEVDSMTTVTKAEDECRVQVPKIAKKRRLQFQDIVDTMPVMMEVEDEHPFHSQNEVDSVNIMTEKLLLMLMEKTAGDPATIESPVKMGRPKKNCTVTSKATAEKKVPMNKAWVAFAPPPPPSLKAVRAKIVSWRNTYHRPSEACDDTSPEA